MTQAFNISQIMKTAWAIRKEYAAKINCPVTEVLMSECLKMAWSQAKAQDAMTPEQHVIESYNEQTKNAKIKWEIEQVIILPTKQIEYKGGIKWAPSDNPVAIITCTRVDETGKQRWCASVINESGFDTQPFRTITDRDQWLAKPRFHYEYK